MRRWCVCVVAISTILTAARADTADSPPAGFASLFNGKSLEGWKVHGGKLEAWGADKGILFTGATKGARGGWLMTEKEYGDFELRLEFRTPKGANSGVALRSPMMGNPAYTGMEIQVIDDAGWPGKLQPWQQSGSIYDVVAAKKIATKPAGEWNKYKITCKGRQVTIELNGEQVVDANLDDYKAKSKSHPGLLREKGHIGLQEHGGKVEFRNLHIKELK